MNTASVALRAGVATAFLGLGVLLLAGVDRGPRVADPQIPSSFLIVTSETLRPAFDGLGKWIDASGGSAVVVTVESLHRECVAFCSPAVEMGYLDRLVDDGLPRRILIGGDADALGLEMKRTRERGWQHAPVRTLDQAWGFVEFCREQGWPLPDPVPAPPLAAGPAGDPAPGRGIERAPDGLSSIGLALRP